MLWRCFSRSPLSSTIVKGVERGVGNKLVTRSEINRMPKEKPVENSWRTLSYRVSVSDKRGWKKWFWGEQKVLENVNKTISYSITWCKASVIKIQDHGFNVLCNPYLWWMLLLESPCPPPCFGSGRSQSQERRSGWPQRCPESKLRAFQRNWTCPGQWVHCHHGSRASRPPLASASGGSCCWPRSAIPSADLGQPSGCCRRCDRSGPALARGGMWTPPYIDSRDPRASTLDNRYSVLTNNRRWQNALKTVEKNELWDAAGTHETAPHHTYGVCIHNYGRKITINYRNNFPIITVNKCTKATWWGKLLENANTMKLWHMDNWSHTLGEWSAMRESGHGKLMKNGK